MEKKAIWKFELPIDKPLDTHTLNMPQGAMTLSVLNQGEKLVVYAMVDPALSLRARKFRVFQTGQPFNMSVNYHFHGTVAFAGGEYIVHVFETDRW